MSIPKSLFFAIFGFFVFLGILTTPISVYILSGILAVLLYDYFKNNGKADIEIFDWVKIEITKMEKKET